MLLALATIPAVVAIAGDVSAVTVTAVSTVIGAVVTSAVQLQISQYCVYTVALVVIVAAVVRAAAALLVLSDTETLA